jgi:hypothetical protein
MKIKHNTLGITSLIVQYQGINSDNMPVHIALAKAHNEYHLLWSADGHYETAGYTQIKTKSGNSYSLGGAMKIYKSSINSSKFVNFIKI